jgi:hypothetical protein
MNGRQKSQCLGSGGSLEPPFPLEFTGSDFLFDCAQFVLDLLPLIDGYDSCLSERCGVRNDPAMSYRYSLQSNETDSL